MLYTDMQVATELATGILDITRELGCVDHDGDDSVPANAFDYADTVTETRETLACHLLAWVAQYRVALNSLQRATGETWRALGEDLALNKYGGGTLYDRYDSELIPDAPLDDTFPECLLNLWVDAGELHAEVNCIWYNT